MRLHSFAAMLALALPALAHAAGARAASPQSPAPIDASPPIAITSHAVTVDDYPAESIRLQEQGFAGVEFVIGVTGDVSECFVAASSGFPRLDQGACAVVGRWKYKPATVNQQAVSMRASANVVFQLTSFRLSRGPNLAPDPDPTMWDSSLNVADATSKSPDVMLSGLDQQLSSASASTFVALNTCSTATVRPLLDVIAACDGLLIDAGQDRERTAKVYHSRGMIYLRAGRFSDAEADFSQAAANDAVLIPARIMQATALLYLGDGVRATEIIESVVMMNADSPAALNSRCWIRAGLNDLDSALADCERALALSPAPGTLDSRGLVHLKSMQYERAIGDYDLVLRALPANEALLRASALFGRGVAKRRLGRAGGDQDIADADTLWAVVRTIYESLGVVP